MSHVYPSSINGPTRSNRAGSVTLSEALDLTPTFTVEPIPARRSDEGSAGVPRATTAPPLTLRIASERNFSLLEAITELEPEPEYTIEEALGSLYDEKDQDSSSDDSDIDIIHDPAQRVVKRRLTTHMGEIIVKEVADFLEHAYSPTRRPSLHHQLRALHQLSHPKSHASVDKPGNSAVVPAPSTTSKHNVLLSLIALQLLASTFTPTPSPACLPAALYMTQVERTQPHMISALKMHSLMSAQAPAAGHHVRPPSPAPVWPALLERDREEILADEVTRKRLDRIRQERNAGSQSIKNIVKQEELVRWMWDPPNYSTRLPIDNASTSGYSHQTVNLRRLNRGPAEPDSDSKGKGRIRQSSSSTDLPAQDVSTSSSQRLDVPQLHAAASASWPPFHMHNNSTASSASPRLPGRIQSHLPLRFSASDTSPTPRPPPPSHLHTYPSPPSTPSPLNARLARTGNFEFHPIIRAEPHPVYVQPVKAIAVKRKRFAYAGNRWQRMRERDMVTRQRDARDGQDGSGGGGDNGSDDETRRRSSGGT